MKVTKWREWMNPKKGKPQWYVTLDDGTEAVCFDAEIKEITEGSELPAGWVLDPPKQEGWNPMLRAPGKQKGPGGYKGRSVEEQLSIDAYHNERMDRRTAIMQAVQATDIPARILPLADEFYAWLRASVPSAQPRTAGSLGDGTESAGPGAERLPSPGSAPSSASGAGAEGKIQVDNKADLPSASPAAPSEAVDKGVEPVSFGKGGPGSAPDLLAKAAELYGSPSRVLRAARMLHDFNTVEEIDAATLAGLIARKSA